jgi:hypothetical protein
VASREDALDARFKKREKGERSMGTNQVSGFGLHAVQSGRTDFSRGAGVVQASSVPFLSEPYGGKRNASFFAADDAESVTRMAIRELIAVPERTTIVLLRAIRDSSVPSPLPGEDLCRSLVHSAGFDATTRVKADRRGYVHEFLVMRKGRETMESSELDHESCAFAINQLSLMPDASIASRAHLA